MIGKQFGPFKIVRADAMLPRRWVGECQCCGIERSLPEHRLAKRQGFVCTCVKASPFTNFMTGRLSHGMSQEPIYAVWGGMKSRCSNPNHKFYYNYGGRGITVCDRWQKFENFLEDMGSTYRQGLTLEREDNDGNYEPDNCFWTTWAQQNRNQRRTVFVDTCRGRMTMQDAAKLAGLTWRGMMYRVTKGVSGEDLFAPAKVNRRAA